MNFKVLDYDLARQILALGGNTPFIEERIWFEVSEGQLNASCPDFITEEPGSLKTKVFNKQINDRFFILTDATMTVNGVLIGNPWNGLEINIDKLHEYGEYYGYEKIMFDAEMPILVEEVI